MATGAEFDAPGIMPFFVYGTLLNADGGSRAWLKWVNRIQEPVIVSGYSLYVTHGGFPYAIEDKNDSYVFGELLWPADDQAAGAMTHEFDRIEGHPSHYTRTAVEVMRSRTDVVPAWMYVMKRENMWQSDKLHSIGSSWVKWKKENPHAQQAYLENIITNVGI